MSPEPKILSFFEFLFKIFNFFNKSKFILSVLFIEFFSIKYCILPKFIFTKSFFFLFIGLNPLLGSLLYKGICPPSKLLIATPDLDFCSL